MSQETLSARTLVLNKNWQPLITINVKDALGKIYCGSAKALGRDFVMYDFDDWIASWSDLSLADQFKQHFIHCSSYKILVPEIIVLTDYKGTNRREARFSRRNIFLRDNFTCQYCRKKFPTKKLNIDHVLPRSRGGATNWTNIVLSCIPCNTHKADRTPKEASMPLMRQPFKPSWSALQNQLGQNAPHSWKTFVDLAYWNTKLDKSSDITWIWLNFYESQASSCSPYSIFPKALSYWKVLQNGVPLDIYVQGRETHEKTTQIQ